MQKTPFTKYHGAGNDFILIDQRVAQYIHPDEDGERIAALCDRHFGIGADGLILLQEHADYDFEMIYFNADGQPSSMCGNGGRCIVSFAHQLGMIGESCQFLAVDGPHAAKILREGWVELKMGDVEAIEIGAGYFFLDTGSPHYIQYVDQVAAVEVVAAGRAIRYNERFSAEGTNVNFVELKSDGIAIATYERGVEDETLACGTGVTAAAIATYLKRGMTNEQEEIAVAAKGGDLVVRFSRHGQGFKDIWLCGPTAQVFEGLV